MPTKMKTNSSSRMNQVRKKLITMAVTAIVIFMMLFTYVMIGVINTLNGFI